MSNTYLDILLLLSDQQFHSGNDIARKFQCSRSAIWYQIQKLKKMGFCIHSIPNRGYKLASFFDPIDLTEINRQLQEQRCHYHLSFIPKTGSTNTDLLNIAKQDGKHRSVLITEYQTDGRGRRGKRWQAMFGTNLLFSILYRFENRVDAIATLTLPVGVSLVRTLRRFGILNVKLKWPNDLLDATHYGKIAGTLTEVQGDILGPSAAIIGIGMNIYDQNTKQEIDYPYTSLASMTDHLPDRNTLLAQLLIDLNHTMIAYEEAGLAPFVDEFNQYCAWKNQVVTATLPSGEYLTGICRGIDENGALLITDSETRFIHRLITGNISLRQSS